MLGLYLSMNQLYNVGPIFVHDLYMNQLYNVGPISVYESVI